MDHIGRRLLVKDIDKMIAFYQDNLNAKVIDRTDVTAYISIEDDVLELVMGIAESPPSAISIQFTSEDAFKEVCDRFQDYSGFSVRLLRNQSQSTYKAEINDIEGNIIHLYHHQMFIPIA